MDLPGAASLAADVHGALVAGVEEEVQDARHLLRSGQLAPVRATVVRGKDPGELRAGQDRVRGWVESKRVHVGPERADERIDVAERGGGGQSVVGGPRPA